MCNFGRWMGVLTLATMSLAATRTSADQGPAFVPATIEERAAGAERVVVASVQNVTASYETNEFGDRLIVSHARLEVEEALKGPAEAMTLDYEGGTVDGMTLHVSTLPVLTPGERGVFFVTRGKKGQFKPHLRGQGILKLDKQNRVPNSSLTLDDLRLMAGDKSR